MNREILRLAVPSIVSNITVPLLSLVDIAIVGHMGRAEYLGAIGVGAMVFNVMYWLFGFLRMGGSGLTAQAFGAENWHLVETMLRRTLLMGCGIGAVFVALSWPLREVAVVVMQADDDIAFYVRRYFDICIFGAPAVLGSFALNGWLIGMQNTRIPMRVAIVQNVLNIVLSVALVYSLGMAIEGVALGTMLSQWAGFALLGWESFKLRREFYSLSLDSLSLLASVDSREKTDASDSASLAVFFRVNADIFLRTVCLVAVNLYFTSAGSAQGTLILAANTVLMTFFTLFSYFMDGFAYAGEALGGRFLGAGQGGQVRLLEKTLLCWGWAMVVVFTAVYACGADAFLALLTDDEQVWRCASDYRLWTLLIPVAGVWAFVYDGLFIGQTRTREMLLSCLVGTVAFFGLYLWLARSIGNHALWTALVVYLLLRGVVLKVLFGRGTT